jgi:CheY-like chemotaxis protein/HPt (histidine-containing phosphotransfer) domain-containing protein
LQEQPSVGPRERPGLEVVIVDDDAIDRLVLTSQVRALGWQAVAIDSGAALLTAMEERVAAGAALPDVLIVDWQMPCLDGLQTLAGMSARAGLGHVPSVILAHAGELQALSALQPAPIAARILRKPVGSSDLFNAVNDCLARSPGGAHRVLQSTRVDGGQTLWLAGVQILLTDDSEINLEVARRLLERRGAQVQTCSSGAMALQRLQAQPAAFDVVLMDVQMPEMDGLEATRRIRSELGLSKLPIIALTAGALVEERRRALDAGMQGFIAKPLDPVELIRVVRLCIEAASGRVLPVTEPPSRAETSTSRWPAIVGIDASDAAQRLGHDVPLFLSLLQQLLSEFGAIEADTVAFSTHAERLALSARMHKLRGCAGTLGARELQQLAAAAETALRADAPEAIAEVRAALGATARLAVDCAGVLAARPTVDEKPAPVISDPHTLQHLEALLQQLRCQDLAAIDSFEVLKPRLRQGWGVPAIEAIASALDSLEFSAAQNLLRARMAPASCTSAGLAGSYS